MSRDLDNVAFVRELQMQLRAWGYYRGAIDGHAGPQTKGAAARYVRERNASLPAVLGESAPSWPGPSETQMTEFYGPPIDAWNDERFAEFAPPYPMFFSWDGGDTPVTRIRAHYLVAPRFEAWLSSIADHYSPDEIRDYGLHVYGGCWNNRARRGGTRLSEHAWAAALDLAPWGNLLRTKWPADATMPVRVVELAEAQGLTSYARVYGRDAMHFCGVRH